MPPVSDDSTVDCAGDAKKKKETKLGLAHSKQGSFGDWYSEVVVESEMISYYDVSGIVLPSQACVYDLKYHLGVFQPLSEG